MVNVPNFRDDNTFLSPDEAKKALHDLMTGGMNQELNVDVEIDMSQATIDALKEGITLLLHQVHAWRIKRIWQGNKLVVSLQMIWGTWTWF